MLGIACNENPDDSINDISNFTETLLPIPAGFPYPPMPTNNLLSEARIALGKQLFSDPILSRDSTVSCASCHHSNHAFSDTVAFSLGVDQLIGTRNSPSLINVAYHPHLLREGGIATLEQQVLVPIQEHNEFDFNIVLISERLQADPNYVQLSQRAYRRAPDHFVITRAIAAYERTLISGNSPYDQYFYQGDSSALSASALNGWHLFDQVLSCSSCHSGFNFSNYAFENNGLYEIYPDSGRIRLTGLPEDRARFKVPSLRNVAVTAPYMHDGSLASLEAVLTHYQTGGKPHENKSPLLEPFTLTIKEQ